MLEGDVFRQIKITVAQFKVNCGSFPKQYSIYDHNKLSSDSETPSVVSGCGCICAHTNTWPENLALNHTMCDCVVVSIEIYCILSLCLCEHCAFAEVLYVCISV